LKLEGNAVLAICSLGLGTVIVLAFFLVLLLGEDVLCFECSWIA
jgi:hypothetical protein